MQRGDVAGQPLVPIGEPPMQVADVRLGGALCLVERIAKLLGDAHAILGPLVNVKHDLAEARALQA